MPPRKRKPGPEDCWVELIDQYGRKHLTVGLGRGEASVRQTFEISEAPERWSLDLYIRGERVDSRKF